MMDEKGLYDIYSVWHVPFWQTRRFFWSCVTATTLVCTALLWILYRWYRAKQRTVLTPWQHALEQLTALHKETYATKQQAKECYFAMTSILKTYLHARYQYDVLGKTDEELVSYLQKQSNVMPELPDTIQEICAGCLLIKFANQEALAEQITTHLNQSIELVKQTIPQEKSAAT